MSEGTDSIDLESNPDLSEIFEAISKDTLQNKSDLSSKSFFLDVDKKIETGVSETRKFGRPDINNFLHNLKVAPITKQKYAKSLSVFYKAMIQYGLEKYPMQDFIWTKFEPTPTPLKETEIFKLLDNFIPTNFTY
jgi:hypothetical protein